MTPAIAIDLGTSYTRVGVWKDGKPHVISNDHGASITASSVVFAESGWVLKEAGESQSVCTIENTVFDVKRLVGRRFSDETVQSDCKYWPFSVTSDTTGKAVVKLTTHNGEQKTFHPEEILALLLTKMRLIAESFLGEKVKDAVVSVPVYFNYRQRHAVRDAGKIAGLNILRLINETSAVGLAYGLDHQAEKGERNVLVFDLGGGTLDVSLLTIQEGSVEVKAHAGDINLGGADFDNRLVDYCVIKIQHEYDVDIRGDPEAFRRLRIYCERAKRLLSTSSEALVEVESSYESQDFSVGISRQQFEKLNDDYFAKCMESVQKVLTDSQISKEEVDEVILSGGSSRIPKVRELIQDYFDGKELCCSLNPDQAVICGAAIQAAMLTDGQNPKLNDLQFRDVTSYSQGVEVKGKKMSKLIYRNSTIPARAVGDFLNETDKYNIIDLFEGESDLTADNNLLSTVDLCGAISGPKFKVKLNVDVNGNLYGHVSGKGKSRLFTVTNEKYSLSEQDAAEIAARVAKFVTIDAAIKKRTEAKNSLERCCNSVKAAISEELAKNMRSTKAYAALDSDINETIAWCKNDQLASIEDFDAKRSELEKQSVLTQYKAEQAAAQDREEANKLLKEYCHGLISSLSQVTTNESIEGPVLVAVESDVSETIAWCENEQTASMQDIDNKRIELENKPAMSRYRAEQAALQDRIEARESLKNYCCDLQLSLSLEETIDELLRTALAKTIDDVLDWFEDHQNASKQDFITRRNELDEHPAMIWYRTKQLTAQERSEARHSLEEYCQGLKDSLSQGAVNQMIDELIRTGLAKTIDDVLHWCKTEQSATKEDFETRRTKLQEHPVMIWYRAEEVAAQEKIKARDSLEKFCHDLKDSLSEDSENRMIDKSLRTALAKTVDDALEWSKNERSASRQDLEAKQTELEKHPLLLRYRAEQATAEENIRAKNDLLDYCFSVNRCLARDSVNEIIDETDRITLKEKAEALLAWSEINQNPPKMYCEAKQMELEYHSLMRKLNRCLLTLGQ